MKNKITQNEIKTINQKNNNNNNNDNKNNNVNFFEATGGIVKSFLSKKGYNKEKNFLRAAREKKGYSKKLSKQKEVQ